jgi:hypothetical protein
MSSGEPQPDGLQELLSMFGRFVGLADLAFDEAGHCVLGIDGVVLNLERDATGGRLLIYSLVGRPAGDPATVYAALLRANYLGMDGTGMGFGLRPDDDGVVLSRWLEAATLDLPAFEAALQAFVDTAEAWTVRLAGPADGAPVSQAAPMPGGLRA